MTVYNRDIVKDDYQIEASTLKNHKILISADIAQIDMLSLADRKVITRYYSCRSESASRLKLK